MLPFPGPMLFLDKACICQTDVAVKEQGISKLGAFVARSDRMVVVYTADVGAAGGAVATAICREKRLAGTAS